MRKLIFLLFIPLLWLTACSNSTEAYIASADSTTLAHNVSDIASPSRKIIRTADIRCRVSNVYDAASKLEDMTRSLDGMVTDSRIENRITNSETIHYKPDSQKIAQTYTGAAHLTLRVPSFYLDTLMKQIPALASFMDTRNLKQEDVTLAYLSNAMKNEAAGVASPAVVKKKGSNELVANTKQTKIDSGKADVVVDRRIDNLQMLDDVNYATLTVELYQPGMADVLVVANPAYATRIPFDVQFAQALSGGWYLFQNLFLVWVRLWPLWVLCAIGYGVYRVSKKRKVITR
jgi:hypothetical protein